MKAKQLLKEKQDLIRQKKAEILSLYEELQALGCQSDEAENSSVTGKDSEVADFLSCFDFTELQQLQDSLADALSISSVVVGMDGEPLTDISNGPLMCSDPDCPVNRDVSVCYSESVNALRQGGSVYTGCAECGFMFEGGVALSFGQTEIGYWLFGLLCEQETAEEEDEKGGEGTQIIPELVEKRLTQAADVIQGIVRQISSMAERSLQEGKRITAEREKAIRVMQTILEQAPFGIVVAEGTPEDWAITGSNAEAVRIVGDGNNFIGVGVRNGKVVQGQSLTVNVREEGVQEFPLRRSPLVRAMVRGETTRSAEIVMEHPSGARYDILGNCAPVKDSVGNIIGSVAVFQDITERIAEEHLLRERESLYRSLFEETVSGIYIWDVERRLMAVNPAATAMHRRTQEEMLGKTPRELFVTKDTQHRFYSALAQASDYRGHTQGVRADGSLFDAEVAVRPVGVAGQQHVFCAVQDISSRKARERQLALTQFGVDNASVGIVRLDENGDVLYANKVFSDMIGYSYQEIFKTNVTEYSTDITREVWAKRWRSIREEGQASLVREMIRKDGSLFPVNIRAHYLVWGKEEFLFAFITDISEKEATELALRESEAQYRTLFDSAIEGLMVFNPQKDKLIAVNDSCARMHGYTVEEYMNIHPRDLAADPASYELVVGELSANRDYLGEVQGRHKDGRILDMELRGRSIIVDGEAQYVVSLRNVTDQKKAESEVLSLRGLLTSMINALPSALIALDSSGVVIRWNKGAERMFGFSDSDAIGQNFFSLLIIPDDGTAVVQRVLSDNLSGEALAMPVSWGGESGFVDLTAFPLTVGETVGAVVRVDDVTERVKLDDVMVQAEKMLSVGGLAAGMAHEVNNPLGGILQGVQNIMRRISPDIEANETAADQLGCSLEQIRGYLHERKVLRMLDGIRSSGERAAKIVSNMLDFARKSNQECTQCDLEELVNSTIAIAATDYDIKRTYDFKHITVETELGENLPILLCYESELGQVLLNLLRNAAQAHYENQTVDPKIIVRVWHDAKDVVIEVEDNGPGMPEDVRKRAFEPFFTTKSPGVGTGLGLAVSYFIITQNHGGAFVVESELGEGTQFILRIPLTGVSDKVFSLKE